MEVPRPQGKLMGWPVDGAHGHGQWGGPMGMGLGHGDAMANTSFCVPSELPQASLFFFRLNRRSTNLGGPHIGLCGSQPCY